MTLDFYMLMICLIGVPALCGALILLREYHAMKRRNILWNIALEKLKTKGNDQ